MVRNPPTSIVFITGTFLSNNCWDEWSSYFEMNGFECHTPPWPNKEASAEELRNRHPDAAIASTRLLPLTDHFAHIIHQLPDKPILIGHSLGGLIVQLLLQRGLGSAGVAMHSFPPKGVISFKFSFIKAWWQAIGLFSSAKKTYLMSFREWKYLITNGMNCEQQKELYYKYAIPESKLVIRDSCKRMTKINFKNAHAPLLLTSGGHDRMIPASLSYTNYKRYDAGGSIADYREFKDINHLVFDQPAWLEEADFILYWLKGVNK